MVYSEQVNIPDMTQLSSTLEKISLYRQGSIAGIGAFIQTHRGGVLTSANIYNILMTALLDSTHPSLWNAGFVMGWTQAYHENPPSMTPRPAHILAEQVRQREVAQLLSYVMAGELTLREAANTIDGLMFLLH